MVMKRKVFPTTVVVLLLLTQLTYAGASIVMNGSFETNGKISDITQQAPKHWCDVNIPASKFAGSVDSQWKTEGKYSLMLSTKDVQVFAGDMASVSQQVYLTDVNEIIFDLKLDSSYWIHPWDPNDHSAVVRIDNTIVWDSNDYAPNEDNEYLNQRINIDDANSHILSLILRANTTGSSSYEYYAIWDFVKFNTHCGGFGYLPGDFNHDCYVDMNDLDMLSTQWLEDANDRYDLYRSVTNNINFNDYAIFADDWMLNSFWENHQDDDCYQAELLDSDLNNDGVTDLRDFAILAEDWTSQQDCLKGDIDCSGIVDYNDISIMSDDWLLRSWLYYLD